MDDMQYIEVEYDIDFNEENAEDVRYARHLGEVKWYSKIATEEREYGYTLEHYIEEFKRNKINFDCKTIPMFIDTFEQVKKKLKRM